MLNLLGGFCVLEEVFCVLIRNKNALLRVQVLSPLVYKRGPRLRAGDTMKRCHPHADLSLRRRRLQVKGFSARLFSQRTG